MSDDPTDDADRLEAALERIAALAGRRPEVAPIAAPAPAAASAPAGDPPTAEVAARLDSLIAQLRANLAHTGA